MDTKELSWDIVAYPRIFRNIEMGFDGLNYLTYGIVYSIWECDISHWLRDCGSD